MGWRSFPELVDGRFENSRTRYGAEGCTARTFGTCGTSVCDLLVTGGRERDEDEFTLPERSFLAIEHNLICLLPA